MPPTLTPKRERQKGRMSTPTAAKKTLTLSDQAGCHTCRARRKKCDNQLDAADRCQTCLRLRLKCVWPNGSLPGQSKDSQTAAHLGENIQTFRTSRTETEAPAGPRSYDTKHEPHILDLADDTSYETHSQQRSLLEFAIPDDSGRILPFELSNSPAVRGTWSSPMYPYTPYHVGQQPLPPHDMEPQTPSSQYHAFLAPHETPLDSYNRPLPPPNGSVHPFASSRTQEPNLYAGAEPWHYSSFEELYHLPTTFSDDVEHPYNGQQLDPSLFNDWTNAYAGLIAASPKDHPHAYLNSDPSIDSLVDYYMHAVVNVQYLLANKSSTATMISTTIQENSVVRDAVRLLASVHHYKHQTQRTDDRALMRVEHPATGIYEELRGHLFGEGGPSSPLQMAKSFVRREYSTEDAMAALLVISSLLYDGGMGDWRVWLRVVYAYVDNLLDRYPNQADALFQVTDDNVCFIIKNTLCLDVIASITTREPPHYLDLIEDVFFPTGASSHVYLPFNMLDVMGCDNNTFWAMARTSELACWKARKIHGGALSVYELVQKGTEIEQALTHTSLSMQSGDGVDDEESCRLATAAIFRSSTLAWLHSIISGDRPHVPEVARAVQDIINRLKSIPSTTARERRLERSIVRSTVFSIFICGVFTSKRSDRELVMKTLDRQSSDYVGNYTAIKMLLKGIWDRYEREGGKSSTVKWREPLRSSGILLASISLS